MTITTALGYFAFAALMLTLILRHVRRRRELKQYHWRPSPGHPDWFDWVDLGLALGSDRRFKPKGERERCAYVMGLRDAARIVEAQRYIKTPINRYIERAGCRPSVKAIHAYTLDFLGLPANDSPLGD
jgi:hypothetical protein